LDQNQGSNPKNMKNNSLIIFSLTIALIFLLTPFNSYCQVQRNKVKKERNSARTVKPQNKQVWSQNFVFGPGANQKISFPVKPANGLFTVKIEWEGNAGELRAKLTETSRHNSEHVKIQGRSPMYISYLFDKSHLSRNKRWMIDIENLHPSFIARGNASVISMEHAASQNAEASSFLNRDKITFNELNQLDRSDWGKETKEIEGVDKMKIKYANGNYIAKSPNGVIFYEARSAATYVVVEQLNNEGGPGYHIIPHVQAPTEPPKPGLFFNEAKDWRDSVERWINSYNNELLDEIKGLMNNNTEYIEQYQQIEREIGFRFIELVEFRIKIIKDLRLLSDN
jgi:hypothetical protein